MTNEPPHQQPSADPRQALAARLLGETSRIAWPDLEKFYARGQVVQVDASLNLVDVAVAMAEDEASAIDAWMQKGKLFSVAVENAQRWHDSAYELWAVVVAPWVLIQDKAAE